MRTISQPSRRTLARVRARVRADRDRAIREALMPPVSVRRLPVPPPVEDGPFPITLTVQRKAQTWASLQRAWGIPLKLDDLESLPLTAGGGHGVFVLPPMPQVGAHMVKIAARGDALGGLVLLAMVAVGSQLTLSEAAGVALDAARLDPTVDEAPGATSGEWSRVAVLIANAWQARRERADGRGVGDEVVLVTRLHEMRVLMAEREIAHIEARDRARLARLRALTGATT